MKMTKSHHVIKLEKVREIKGTPIYKLGEKTVLSYEECIDPSFGRNYVLDYRTKVAAKYVYTYLKREKFPMSFAESVTGGLLASALVEVPGASEVLDCGIVAYSNESKIELLGVKEKTLKKYGAVSAEVALEMAEGLFQSQRIILGVSTTGIAGPKGDGVCKNVGLVYIALSKGIHSAVMGFQLEGDRNEIREQAVKIALNMILAHSLGSYLEGFIENYKK